MAGAYEFALSEWGRDPQWVNENWTDGMFLLLISAAGKRLERQYGGAASGEGGSTASEVAKVPAGPEYDFIREKVRRGARWGGELKGPIRGQ